MADESIEDKLLNLLSDPFGGQLANSAVVTAVLTSFAITGAIILAFCLIRPFNTIVYAPRLRHADDKHKPPPIGKGMLAWTQPVFKTNEEQNIDRIGMDATVFLRVARMCRNMFAILAVIGCGIVIPVNYINSSKNPDISKDAILMMTPKNLGGEVYWTFIAVAYIFNVIVCGFLWWNYRAIHRLRRQYMDSPEYQNSLYARTLMITDISRNLRSDQGLVEITDSLRTTPEVPKPSIGRNVKDIPDMIEEHKLAVEDLEAVLSKYLKNPNKLPSERPLCRPSKKDPEYVNKEEKVDAITYLTARIERLEEQIKATRMSVDKRDAMSYGFASYETIESAHTVAFSARSKHPKGATVQLAPRPKDIIWKNLALTPSQRRWKRFVNNLWVALLTMLYFIPNALIAVFIAQLKNIGYLWTEFQVEMTKNPNFWGVVQGLLAPALTSLFYFLLPIIFRRLSINAGDLSKTSRERHVIHGLYSFFVINNLIIFSLFGAIFSLVLSTISVAKEGGRSFEQVIEAIHPFQTVMIALCDNSPYWVTWLVQRNLGAAIDLAQLVNLAWGSFSRKFLNPTPRELINRTAPPPFDYASYYNYFLFYSTVAMCFATIQPITLPVVAVYFTIDAWMKKYLLMYVFCTKNESGGLFWRVVYNRFLVGLLLSNCIVALMVTAKGNRPYFMLACMAPAPILLLGFKFYCKSAFDNSIKYYTKGNIQKGAEAQTPIDKEARRRDRVAVRFGHPALYQKLTVPMVHEKSKHLLPELYRGRLDGDLGGDAGFSDIYMKRMSKENPGKAAGGSGPFEFVSENNMDFENYKNRPEFSDEHGGEGSIYGGSVGRPDTPNSMFEQRGRPSTRDSDRPFSPDENGVTYPAGYHHTPSQLREYSPSPDRHGFSRVESSQSNPYQSRDQAGLLGSAAPMGHQPPQSFTPYSPERDGQTGYFQHR